VFRRGSEFYDVTGIHTEQKPSQVSSRPGKDLGDMKFSFNEPVLAIDQRMDASTSNRNSPMS
jgi:hypothetical protein